MSRLKRIACTIALVALAWRAAGAEDQAPTLGKPLSDYRIGDLIPRLPQAVLDEVGRNWRRCGDELRTMTDARRRDIDAAMPAVKDEIGALRSKLKTARAAKRTVEAGTLDGEIAAARARLEILETLESHAGEQASLADAWVAAGTALMEFDEADRSFESHRLRKITQAEQVGSAIDERLDAEGYGAFRRRAAALEALGRRLSELGARARSVGRSNTRFLADLERDGRIQPER